MNSKARIGIATAVSLGAGVIIALSPQAQAAIGGAKSVHDQLGAVKAAIQQEDLLLTRRDGNRTNMPLQKSAWPDK
jgi:hypothetical protein